MGRMRLVVARWLRAVGSRCREWAIRLEAGLPVPLTLSAFMHRSRGWNEGRNWWRRQQMKDPCVFCGGQAITSDHIKARSQGGPDNWGNRAPACRRCNQEKGAMGLLQFLIIRQPAKWRPVSPIMSQKSSTTTYTERKIAAAKVPVTPVTPPYWVNDMRHRQPDDIDLREMRKTLSAR